MKNKVLKGLCVALFLTGIIISCRKEIADKSDESALDIMKARSWYENQFSSKEVFKSADFAKGKINIKPLWEISLTKDHKDFKTVEVPISTQGQLGFVTMESKHAYIETHDKRYMQSITSLVILLNKKDNTTIGFLMTIIPEKDYRLKKEFKVFNSSYLNWQDGFSGYILYHNFDGTFSNGWKISDGVIDKSVNQDLITNIDIQLKPTGKSLTSVNCSNIYIGTWYVDCTDWYQQTEWSTIYTGTTCGAPYQVWEYEYTSCTYNGGGSNGDGGGYIPPINGIPQLGATPYSDKIYKCTSTLTPTQKSYLEVSLRGFAARYPLFGKIWDKLVNSHTSIKFVVDSSLVPHNGLAAFLTDNTIAFKDEKYININFLTEELIHAYQFLYYGTSMDNVIRNFEFENKVIQDLACYLTQGACSFIGAIGLPSGQAGNYIDWMTTITATGLIDGVILNNFCYMWTYTNTFTYCDSNFVPSAAMGLMNGLILP